MGGLNFKKINNSKLILSNLLLGPNTDFYHSSVNKKDFEKLRMDSSAKNRAFIDKFVGRLSITKSFFNFFFAS